MVVVIVGCTQPVSLVAAESKANLLRYLLFRRGMLTSNVAEACAFLRASPDSPAPDLELVFAPVPYIDHGLVPPAQHGVSIGAALLRPASRGRILLRSADPAVPPRIEANYLSDPTGNDLRILLHGVKQAQQIFSMPAFAPFVGEPIEPSADLRSDAELETFIREQAETVYHPVGTCRMGLDHLAVVDPELRVRGVEGLRVVDAAVMPTIIRGHPYAPTVMIAEKAAELIRGTRPPSIPVPDTRAARV